MRRFSFGLFLILFFSNSHATSLERFQSYLRSLVTQVEERAAQGRSLAEIQHAVDLHEYDDFVTMPFLSSRARNIGWVYEEVTGKKE